jgi:hypothetical protein
MHRTPTAPARERGAVTAFRDLVHRRPFGSASLNASGADRTAPENRRRPARPAVPVA